MSIFQILAIIFGLSMAYVVTIHRSKHLLSKIEYYGWMSLWALFVVLAFNPNLLLGITTQLHFARVFDLLLVGALMVLSIVVFTTYFRQKKHHQQLHNLIREVAMDEAMKPKKSSKKSQKK